MGDVIFTRRFNIVKIQAFNPEQISGMIAYYEADNFSGVTWTEKTGTYNRNTSRGTITKTTSQVGNGVNKSFTILRGDQGTGISFFDLPTQYTLFHVTRYQNTGRIDRIFTGTGDNWLSGFWTSGGLDSSQGGSGVAYHGSWLTQLTSSVHGRNWVLSTDQNNLYRSNGVTRGTLTSGGNHPVFGICTGDQAGTEDSAWECAEIIVYNRWLTSEEYLEIEQYLKNKYGFTY